ncbi:MAG: RNA polymerase sigma factor [Planctomycetia bacterium]|nr:RNA polymerase sigma factor [Planctomycetia bacterium]MCC7313715.1 RNA polymerase sigma factor [Planctomycetota bacterium]
MQLAIPIPQTHLTIDDAEAALVERAKRDREAFAILYRRHYGMIVGYILRRIGDAHAAEDLTADVFTAALRYLPRYRQRGVPIKAWLYRIATTTVNRWVRRQQRRSVIEGFFAAMRGPTDGNGASSGGNGSVRHDLPETDAERARLALLELPPKFQTVLSLHYLEGLSLQDIAVAVGCRLGTVKSRLSRGRDAMRERLLKRRPPEAGAASSGTSPSNVAPKGDVSA